LSDTNELAASDVLVFVREIILKYSNFKGILLQKLLEIFPGIKSAKILRGTLWIVGEYCETVEDIQNLITLIRQSLGDLPIVDDELKRVTNSETNKEEDLVLKSNITNSTPHQLVTADGTYATQSAFALSSMNSSNNKEDGEKRPTFRNFLVQGNFFIATALARTLTKLAFKYLNLVRDNQIKQNYFIGESMYIMASILHFGKSGLAKKPISEDDVDSINLCLRVLSDKSSLLINTFSQHSQITLSRMLDAKLSEKFSTKQKPAGGASSKKLYNKVETDDPLRFGQLVSMNDLSEKEDVFDLTLKQAIGVLKKQDDFVASSKLNKVTQLTGFSDPVYAEAYVHVNQFDIVLDVLIVNQTSDTLQNLTLELATLGDLKLVEKPQSLTLAPRDFTNIKANIKVASTENGIIFGNIVYDITGAASDRNCVVLNDIHIDIMDYIVPAECTDQEFLQMWVAFEWENKVVVNTNIKDLNEYLEHIIKSTNMKCLTPNKALSGDCGFMAANLYAKSIFGEDVLANLSIEKPLQNPYSQVHGHIRIRAKSQGMALSMGDKINLTQKQARK
jgi:coatomer subunit beta